MSVVGLELSARAYPSGAPLRDRGQINLLGRLTGQVSPPLTWRAEVPIGGAGDPRAWDLVISNGRDRVAVEAETRLSDLQAVQRRIALKSRDSGITTVILLLAASRTNRTTSVSSRTRSEIRSPRRGPRPCGTFEWAGSPAEAR